MSTEKNFFEQFCDEVDPELFGPRFGHEMCTPEEYVAKLRAWKPAGPWPLYASFDNGYEWGEFERRIFTTADIDEAAAWVQAWSDAELSVLIDPFDE